MMIIKLFNLSNNLIINARTVGREAEISEEWKKLRKKWANIMERYKVHFISLNFLF